MSSPFILYTTSVKVAGHNFSPDWPKLGPSMLIATALVVAIRTARWGATASADALCSDVNPTLDKEIDFALRITDRVLHGLLRRHPGMFPQKGTPIYEVDEDSPP
jgi:hypothetical protein